MSIKYLVNRVGSRSFLLLHYHLKSYTEAAVVWMGASSLHRNQFRDEKTDLFGLKIG
jgi:hypothetical protein